MKFLTTYIFLSLLCFHSAALATSSTTHEDSVAATAAFALSGQYSQNLFFKYMLEAAGRSDIEKLALYAEVENYLERFGNQVPQLTESTSLEALQVLKNGYLTQSQSLSEELKAATQGSLKPLLLVSTNHAESIEYLNQMSLRQQTRLARFLDPEALIAWQYSLSKPSYRESYGQENAPSSTQELDPLLRIYRLKITKSFEAKFKSQFQLLLEHCGNYQNQEIVLRAQSPSEKFVGLLLKEYTAKFDTTKKKEILHAFIEAPDCETGLCLNKLIYAQTSPLFKEFLFNLSLHSPQLREAATPLLQSSYNIPSIAAHLFKNSYVNERAKDLERLSAALQLTKAQLTTPPEQIELNLLPVNKALDLSLQRETALKNQNDPSSSLSIADAHYLKKEVVLVKPKNHFTDPEHRFQVASEEQAIPFYNFANTKEQDAVRLAQEIALLWLSHTFVKEIAPELNEIDFRHLLVKDEVSSTLLELSVRHTPTTISAPQKLGYRKLLSQTENFCARPDSSHLVAKALLEFSPILNHRHSFSDIILQLNNFLQQQHETKQCTLSHLLNYLEANEIRLDLQSFAFHSQIESLVAFMAETQNSTTPLQLLQALEQVPLALERKFPSPFPTSTRHSQN